MTVGRRARNQREQREGNDRNKGLSPEWPGMDGTASDVMLIES
jgi:hypothetical protein